MLPASRTHAQRRRPCGKKSQTSGGRSGKRHLHPIYPSMTSRQPPRNAVQGTNGMNSSTSPPRSWKPPSSQQPQPLPLKRPANAVSSAAARHSLQKQQQPQRKTRTPAQICQQAAPTWRLLARLPKPSRMPRPLLQPRQRGHNPPPQRTPQSLSQRTLKELRRKQPLSLKSHPNQDRRKPLRSLKTLLRRPISLPSC